MGCPPGLQIPIQTTRGRLKHSSFLEAPSNRFFVFIFFNGFLKGGRVRGGYLPGRTKSKAERLALGKPKDKQSLWLRAMISRGTFSISLETSWKWYLLSRGTPRRNLFFPLLFLAPRVPGFESSDHLLGGTFHFHSFQGSESLQETIQKPRGNGSGS